jgi:nucleoside-diphosphate-sugar epimerase
MVRIDPDVVLVTGGAGMIGAHVARILLAEGLKPILFDFAPSADNIGDIADKVIVERGDIGSMSDLVEVVSRHGVGRIVHLAAVLTIQSAVKPAGSIVTNCAGTAHVFLLAKLFDMKRVVYASSAAVYAPRPYYEKLLGRHLVTEDDPPMPADIYGSTKLMCEALAAQAIREGQDIVGVRPVMTFGLGRMTGAVGILNLAMRDAALTGAGRVTRPWSADTEINPMYVKDCADLIVRTLLAERRLAKPVYNLGTGEYYSIGHMMDVAVSAVPRPAQITFEDRSSTEGGGVDVPGFNYADLDSSALRRELNWSPRYGYEAAARECVEMYLHEARL